MRAPTLTAATLLTQLEYAQKRCGHYGRWTRLTNSSWPTVVWQRKGRVPRRSFRPVPRVDSGILRLERREIPLVQSAALGAYRWFVGLGLSGVRGSPGASLAVSTGDAEWPARVGRRDLHQTLRFAWSGRSSG
jgi:23S rRNA (adenine-N6)-dimethyltransferase